MVLLISSDHKWILRTADVLIPIIYLTPIHVFLNRKTVIVVLLFYFSKVKGKDSCNIRPALYF